VAVFVHGLTRCDTNSRDMTPQRVADGRCNESALSTLEAPLTDAAHRLGLSHSTVKHHLANARSKVGVATTAQLV
jgi:hypothetical protein